MCAAPTGVGQFCCVGELAVGVLSCSGVKEYQMIFKLL